MSNPINSITYDPYELMIIFPNKKAEMIIKEIQKFEPNLNLVSDLIVLGANLNWQDEDYDGWTPLHWAVINGRVEIVRMLIEARADLDVKDIWGRGPLHYATMNGNLKIIGALIEARAILNIQDEWGYTPLHKAIMNGEIETVRMLIDAGAKKDIQDYIGRLPYDLARSEEMQTILRIV